MGKKEKLYQVVDDVHVEWHEEDGTVRYIVDIDSQGLEIEIAAMEPDEKPSFAYADSNETFELSDYQEWYNAALEEAHNQGYKILGEI